MEKLGIYYINLESRRDKDRQSREQLSFTGFPYQRVEAVSDREIDDLKIEFRYFRLVSAVKKSHLKAYEIFLKSDYSYALILEDDFQLSREKISFQIANAIRVMDSKGLHFLQMGYLAFDQISANNVIERFARKIVESLYGLYILVRHPFSDVINGRIRWGAQAYLLDRVGAAELTRLIATESKDPIDLELRRIARCPKNGEFFLAMGRQKKNLIQQELRFQSDTQGVV
jgi:GR25 family glycosyltransferase involved in LPS biosynthesis